VDAISEHTPLEWTVADSVGNDEIDREHQTWFSIVNRLDEAVKSGASQDAIEYVLTAVIEYTRVHFSHEEEEMRRAGFPGFEAHKKIHDEFVDRMERMAELVHSPDLVERLVRATRRWLIHHIRTVDREYVGHL
jgi:hemerythrin-like metal-binding protein